MMRFRIAVWREEGKKVISHARRPGKGGTKPGLEDCLNYWSSRLGATVLDGVIIDEFGNESGEEVPYYTDAIRKFYTGNAHLGKAIYAYSCAAWGSHEQTMDLRKELARGGGVSAPEYYLRN